MYFLRLPLLPLFFSNFVLFSLVDLRIMLLYVTMSVANEKIRFFPQITHLKHSAYTGGGPEGMELYESGTPQ